MVELLINPVGPSLPPNFEPDPAPTVPHSAQGGGRPLPTPPQPLPPPRVPLHPPSNTSAYDFIKDYRYVISHEPLDINRGNQLSIPDNIQALWTRTEHTQRTMEDRDRRIHVLSNQLNEILQAFTGLQRSHQLLQDTVRLNNQEVDEEIATLRSQLDFMRDEHPPTPNLSIFAMADANQLAPISKSPPSPTQPSRAPPNPTSNLSNPMRGTAPIVMPNPSGTGSSITWGRSQAWHS